ncbi:transposase [Melghirimyces profundicolus]|uniref:Transposase n=1 Tax=Melghirimyces profundicolus TaxID=1242148 RepID=A0A2T6AWX2_9BACL|nr:transposase [Melghirimyces profundicolus]
MVNPLHVKKSKELDDNSPTKNDIKDAKVIAQLVKDGRYSEPNVLTGVYADLRVAMIQRDRLTENLKRIKNRMHHARVNMLLELVLFRHKVTSALSE